MPALRKLGLQPRQDLGDGKTKGKKTVSGCIRHTVVELGTDRGCLGTAYKLLEHELYIGSERIGKAHTRKGMCIMYNKRFESVVKSTCCASVRT